MSGVDEDGRTPGMVRETTQEVMEGQGKDWYSLCPGHWPHPTAKEWQGGLS